MSDNKPENTKNVSTAQAESNPSKPIQTGPLSPLSGKSSDVDNRSDSSEMDDEPRLPKTDKLQTDKLNHRPVTRRIITRKSIQKAVDTTVLSHKSPLMRRALVNQQASQPENGTATLGEKHEVILLIRGMVERIVVSEGKDYVLGRYDIGASNEEEIDLSSYGAMDRGVSRIHAKLHLENNNLFITDLDSTNGTYLSGIRLEPQKPTLLRKGDELLLGRLTVQVLFR